MCYSQNRNYIYFYIDLKDPDKQQKYNFGDLLNDACIKWNVDTDQMKEYHIVDENLSVYPSKLLVYEVHKKKITIDNTSLTHAHMELVSIYCFYCFFLLFNVFYYKVCCFLMYLFDFFSFFITF